MPIKTRLRQKGLSKHKKVRQSLDPTSAPTPAAAAAVVVAAAAAVAVVVAAAGKLRCPRFFPADNFFNKPTLLQLLGTNSYDILPFSQSEAKLCYTTFSF